jgi:TatD DNase family protein
MQLIDTHTHLYLPEFDPDRDEIVRRAISNNVDRLLMPNINIDSVDVMLAVEDSYPGTCYSFIGLHPTSVRMDFSQQLEKLEKYISLHKFLAIGEIGIDLYWDKTYFSEQVTAFRRQLSLALDLDLPVVIHSREAFREIFSILDEFKGRGLKGVFHAFSGDPETAEKAIGLGFRLGIGGIVTFKNSGLDKVVRSAGLENIVLETDSPYLAPAPYRGTRNESSYLNIICKKLAEIFNANAEEIASVTSGNAFDLFQIS